MENKDRREDIQRRYEHGQCTGIDADFLFEQLASAEAHAAEMQAQAKRAGDRVDEVEAKLSSQSLAYSELVARNAEQLAEMDGELSKERAKREAVEMQLKRVAPIGKMDGRDIEEWKDRADSLALELELTKGFLREENAQNETAIDEIARLQNRVSWMTGDCLALRARAESAEAELVAEKAKWESKKPLIEELGERALKAETALEAQRISYAGELRRSAGMEKRLRELEAAAKDKHTYLLGEVFDWIVSRKQGEDPPSDLYLEIESTLGRDGNAEQAALTTPAKPEGDPYRDIKATIAKLRAQGHLEDEPAPAADAEESAGREP